MRPDPVRILKLTVALGAAIVAAVWAWSAVSAPLERARGRWLTAEFHKMFHARKLNEGRFLGITSQQYPTDNWIMQEIFYDVKPDAVIETGTYMGGTALYYAMLLEQINPDALVLTNDITAEYLDPKAVGSPLWKKRVVFRMADSASSEYVAELKERTKGKKVLVTLDSDHRKAHVLKELDLYAPLVSVGSYLVVQDTQFRDHPTPWAWDEEGPWQAVQEWLPKHPEFRVDESRNRYLLSQNPSGYLKRVE